MLYDRSKKIKIVRTTTAIQKIFRQYNFGIHLAGVKENIRTHKRISYM